MHFIEPEPESSPSLSTKKTVTDRAMVYQVVAVGSVVVVAGNDATSRIQKQ